MHLGLGAKLRSRTQIRPGSRERRGPPGGLVPCDLLRRHELDRAAERVAHREPEQHAAGTIDRGEARTHPRQPRR